MKFVFSILEFHPECGTEFLKLFFDIDFKKRDCYYITIELEKPIDLQEKYQKDFDPMLSNFNDHGIVFYHVYNQLWERKDEDEVEIIIFIPWSNIKTMYIESIYINKK